MTKFNGIWHVSLLHYSGRYGLCLYLNIIRIIRNIKGNILIENRRLDSKGILCNRRRRVALIGDHTNISLTGYLPVYLDCYFLYRCIFGSTYNRVAFHISSGQICRKNATDTPDRTKRVDCISTILFISG